MLEPLDQKGKTTYEIDEGDKAEEATADTEAEDLV